MDHELLEEYHEGLICLSACLAGEIPQALLAGDYEEAKNLARYYEDLFGKGNYYIEIQDHGLDEQRTVLPLLVRLSRETGIPLVATNDAHYIRREDSPECSTCAYYVSRPTIRWKMKTAWNSSSDEFYRQISSRRCVPAVSRACPRGI